MPKEVPVDEIPEVAEYLAAEQRLEAWIQANSQYLQPLRDLMDEVNTKRQAADKIVRSKGVLCGPWTQHSVKRVIDIDTLIDRIGMEAFLKVGTRDTKVVYTVDRKKFDVALATGVIPKDVADDVVKDQTAYSAPKEPKL